MIMLMLQDEVKDKVSNFGGVYVMSQEEKINGKSVWLSCHEAAIWYDSENWKIGTKSNIGTGACSFYSSIDAQNPTLVGNNWKYVLEEEFVEATPGDIIISTIEGREH